MSSPYNQQQPQPQWYNSPTMQALQNFQTDYVQPPHGQQWGEETSPGLGIRHLVDSERRKQTPVLDYTVGIVSPDDQCVTQQNYRSRQLLYPEPKAKHYYPVGTYMSKPSYLMPSPEPKAAFDTMFQTNLPAPPSVLKPNQRRGGQYYKPSSPAQRQGSWQGQVNSAPSPANSGHYSNSSSFSRPSWVGGSSNSMNAGSPQPTSVSRMVQWPPPSPTEQLSQQPQTGYSIQQPSWQRPNMNNGPMAYEIEVANPDPASRVVHMQYNSPMGMYSAQNVADSLAGQTGLNPTVRKVGDYRQSPTYQAVMADNHTGTTNM